MANKIEIPVNDNTGKLIYWTRNHKLGVPGKFGLIPASQIEEISIDHRAVEGAPGWQIIHVFVEGILYAYSIPEASLADLNAIRLQVQGARDIARINQTLNNR
nr:MAG TPA: hypothetical protein [Caudoviricetes sp.]